LYLYQREDPLEIHVFDIVYEKNQKINKKSIFFKNFLEKLKMLIYNN